MSSEALDKTVITENWQIFSEKPFQHFIHHIKISKVTKFQFKIVCRSRVLDKNIPLRYTVPSPPRCLLELYECKLEWRLHMYKVCQLNKGTNYFHKFTVATRG